MDHSGQPVGMGSPAETHAAAPGRPRKPKRMTILELAATLDDYSGSLAQAVEKLQIERARGALHQDEQMDLLADLRQAVETRLIRPWRLKAMGAGVVAAVMLAVAGFLPADLPHAQAGRLAAVGFAVLAAALSGYDLGAIRKCHNRMNPWFRRAETAVQQSGSVFDVV